MRKIYISNDRIRRIIENRSLGYKKAPWRGLIVHEAHAIVNLKPFNVAPQRCIYALKDGAKLAFSSISSKLF